MTNITCKKLIVNTMIQKIEEKKLIIDTMINKMQGKN
jgi:hypothetical protein